MEDRDKFSFEQETVKYENHQNISSACAAGQAQAQVCRDDGKACPGSRPLEKSAGESADAINELCLALGDIKQGLITLIQASEMYTKQAGDAFQQLDRTM